MHELMMLASSLAGTTFSSDNKHASNAAGSVSIEDMSLMKFAIGNCLAASEATAAEFGLLGEAELVLAHYEKVSTEHSLFMPFHCAVAVTTPDGEEYVVDFTARQFDKKEAFPKVSTLTEWKRDIDSHAFRLFGQTDSVLDFEPLSD